MKVKLLAWGIILLLAGLILLPRPVVMAQTPELALRSLLVELWPEFDRPDLLVIYRGELSADTAFPTRLSFSLPGYVEDMHAVAVEEEGSLLNVDPEAIELVSEGEDKVLTFPVTAPRFQFEYYDPQALSKQDQTRRLDYTFTAPYSIQALTFQLQEPVQTQSFSLVPEPDNTFTGQNDLTYHLLERNNLAADQTVELAGTYARSTDELTAKFLEANTPEEGLDISVVSGSPIGEELTIGYALVGAGLVLLLGTVGYWWWSRRAAPEALPPASRAGSARPGRVWRRKKEAAKRTGAPSASTENAYPSGGFCYRCGTALREDADFCHVCGARRRE